jgi:hypothetical protein
LFEIATFKLTELLLEIHTILYRPVYNNFQTFRKRRQDPKSLQLHHSTDYSCDDSRERFPALTDECPTAEQPHIYVMFFFVTHYFYFQSRFRELLTYTYVSYLSIEHSPS